MDISSVLMLLGGIGLFLYGMNLLGASLERLAGSGLERTLENLTSNRFKGLALGTIVTAVIQSSAATTIMLVGFVNAGVMKFAQTVPVMMGANIGTTVTAQILRLGDVSGSNIFLSLLQPTSFAPLVIAIGAFILLFSRKRKTKDVAYLLIGFGVLFFGMSTMENALAPLSDSEAFQNIFFLFKNPLLGVLFGAVVTAILQSSSASVGVLQAIAASTGAVTFSMAAPIIIGQNIGKCVTILLASIGTNRKAKRVVVCDLIINLIGAALFLIVIYGFQALIGFPFWDNTMTRGSIANFHTLFNVVTSLVLFPFCGQLVKLSKKIMKKDKKSRTDTSLALLDDIFLDRPAVALEQSRKVTLDMGEAVSESFDLAVRLLGDFDEETFEKLNENEVYLDECESAVGEYLVRVTVRNIRHDDQKLVTEMLHAISDFESISDHCVSIAEIGQFDLEQNVEFTDDARNEFKVINEAVRNVLDLTLKAYRDNDIDAANKVSPLVEVIDSMQSTIKDHHVERLSAGLCSMQAGISLTELMNDIDRICEHSTNVAMHLIEKLTTDKNFDTHQYKHLMHEPLSNEYSEALSEYESKYYDQIK